MAVVGFEADQVRRTPQGDVSVPITVAYNHHYGARLIGKGSSMKKVRRSETTDHRAMHPGPDPGWAEIPVEHTPSLSGQPTSMVFGYSNGSTSSLYCRLVIAWTIAITTKITLTTNHISSGGEFRKTYHGLVPPFAQLVDSPVQVHCTPMQIDTVGSAQSGLGLGLGTESNHPFKANRSLTIGHISRIQFFLPHTHIIPLHRHKPHTNPHLSLAVEQRGDERHRGKIRCGSGAQTRSCSNHRPRCHLLWPAGVSVDHAHPQAAHRWRMERLI